MHLGRLDDFDTTYFNGVRVGETSGGPNAYAAERCYTVPAVLVTPGRAMIAVRIFDHFGNGGMAGPLKEMFLTVRGARAKKTPLAGTWRACWQQPALPFLFVQLANYKEPPVAPVDDEWAELREAQTAALALPATGMAAAIDIGDATDIHPRNKRAAGKRLALSALAQVYGRDIVFSGPMYRAHAIEGSAVRIMFDHVDGGLRARRGALRGFAITGADRRFVWAQARIEKDTVLVWSNDVPHPVAVRYAWAANPPCNLYNAAGLPAVPFRTDAWPGMTEGKD